MNFEVVKLGRTENDKKTEYSVKLEGKQGDVTFQSSGMRICYDTRTNRKGLKYGKGSSYFK